MKLAEKAVSGEFDVKFLAGLYRLNGVGVWTAEMLMTFSMRRPNIMSYGDLAIHRGLRMLYHHREINRKISEKHRRRYSPHVSIDCLY